MIMVDETNSAWT